MSARAIVFGVLVALLIGAFTATYRLGASGPQAEVDRMTEVGRKKDVRMQSLEKEVADAQQAYVRSWTALRDKSDADILRLRSEYRRLQVSGVQGVAGGSGETAAAGLGGDCGVDVEREEAESRAVDALIVGKRISDTLNLCQAELLQCQNQSISANQMN